MVPDYSIELCFNNRQREQVQSRIASICELEYGQRIESQRFGDVKWETEICIPAPSDAPPELLLNYRKIRDGRTSIGYIDFEYAPTTQYVRMPDCFSIEIWPRTKDMHSSSSRPWSFDLNLFEFFVNVMAVVDQLFSNRPSQLNFGHPRLGVTMTIAQNELPINFSFHQN